MSTAIEFENIGKQYRLGLVSTRTLSHDLNRWWTVNVLHREDPYLKIGETNDRSVKGSSDYVWALKDINFKVEQGDVVGIIGRNGAGKSTLLKLLSKVTAPTTGAIRARGRIGSLLEVGTGFHPEMTGRENIFMNGAILGMTKSEISRKLDEIVDFSGCERYLDTPVKRYSSGMMVRLGFAVAAHLDPEILVVDEVLAVGDAEFQKKAIGKMKDVSTSEGRTVLFVSHNMAAVRNLCKSGVVLKNGMIDYTGLSHDCVEHYMNSNIESLFAYSLITPKNRDKQYACDVEIIEASIDNDVYSVSVDEPLIFRVKLKNNDSKPKSFRIGIFIRNSSDIRVGVGYSNLIDLNSSNDEKMFRIVVPNHNLAKGRYFVDFNLSNFDYQSFGLDLDLVHNVLSFEVSKVDKEKKLDFLAWHPNMGSCAFQGVDAQSL